MVNRYSHKKCNILIIFIAHRNVYRQKVNSVNDVITMIDIFIYVKFIINFIVIKFCSCKIIPVCILDCRFDSFIIYKNSKNTFHKSRIFFESRQITEIFFKSQNISKQAYGTYKKHFLVFYCCINLRYSSRNILN